MCRLFGLRANKPVGIEFSFTIGPKTFQQFGEKHSDGWGIGLYDRGKPSIRKEPMSAVESQEFSSAVAFVCSDTIISHVRKSSCGNVTLENCHPFEHEKWIFAHNGTVRNRDALLSKLTHEHRIAIRGDTDSEVFFHWILQNVETSDSLPAGLQRALKDVTDSTGLNFLLADGQNLFAYRNASMNRAYYSLYYLSRDPQQASPEELNSKEVGALLRSKTLRGEKAVLVCSERLTEEAWHEIPLGNLLVVGDDLVPQLLEIK